MKILQLLEEPYQTSAFEPKDFGTAQRLGQGLYSNVYKNSDEFTVDKSSIYSGDRGDPFWNYVTGILRNDELKSNPFAPRIFSIDVKSKRANIEKLYSNNNLVNMRIDPEVLIRYLLSVVDMQDTETDIDGLSDIKKYDYFDDCHMLTCVLLKEAIQFGDYSRIKNKKLIQLLQYIHELVIDHKGAPDINGDNIMYRIVPNGIQLVITDPLA